MRIRLFAFCLLILLMVSFSSVAQTNVDDCGQLSADECDHVEDSLRLTNDLSAAAFASEVVLTVREIYSRQYTTIRLFLDGAYRINDDFSNPNPEVAIRGLDSDVSVIVDLSELESFAMEDFGLAQSEFSFDLSLVEGVGYINLSKLMDASELEADWYGIDLGALMQLLLAAAGGLPQESFTQPSSFQVQHLPFGLQATDIQRMSDITINDTEMERYLWTVNFGTLVEDGLGRVTFNVFMLAMLDELGRQQGFNYSRDELDEIIESYALAMEALSLRVERVIHPDDGYIYRTIYNFAYQPSDRLLTELYSSFDPLGLSAIYADVYFDVTIDRAQLDGEFEINVPEGAIIVPIFDLIPLFDDANL